MTYGELQTKEDRIREALGTLNELGYQNRGDSFDLGIQQEPESTGLINALSNPQELMSQLGLTTKQLENVKSIVAGAGAGAGHKLLSRYIGGDLAAAVGGFLGSYISRNLFGGK